MYQTYLWTTETGRLSLDYHLMVKRQWARRNQVCSASIASSQDFNSVLWVSNNRIRVSTMCFSSTPIHAIHKSNWRKHVKLCLEIRTNLATRAEGKQSSKKNGVILHCLHLGTQHHVVSLYLQGMQWIAVFVSLLRQCVRTLWKLWIP